MLQHLLVAAWRNILANKLQSFIGIFGLAVGLAATILAALVLYNQFTYDSFLPQHGRLYVLGVDASIGGKTAIHLPYAMDDASAKLNGKFSEIEAMARIAPDFDGHSLRHGAIKGQDVVLSADPNIFDLLRLPVLFGDLPVALRRPDSVVISLSTARKYFGADNVVGQILTMDQVHPLTVTAVVADLPANDTNLRSAIFVSGKATWTALAKLDAGAHPPLDVDSTVYVRLAPGISLGGVQARLAAMSRALLPYPSVMSARARLIPLAALTIDPDFAPGALDRLMALAAIALAILLLSTINFVNLVTARATRRGVEVGVRKAAGATRRDLMFQFLGEAVVQALIALVLALAAVEWLLPVVNAALQTGATLSDGSIGIVAIFLVGGAMLQGLLAGFYPALILSAFRPSLVLKGGPITSGRNGIRQVLVILQFAVLVILGIGAVVLLMQYRFALNRTVEHADRTLFVAVPKCEGKFQNRVAALPGVDATACTDITFVKAIDGRIVMKLPRGGTLPFEHVTAGPGLLPMVGQPPIAGRDLSEADRVNSIGLDLKASSPPIHILINRMGARRMGFSTAEAAIGQALHPAQLEVPMVIVGVVPDFSTYAFEQPIGPTVYYYRADIASLSPLLAVKFSGDPALIRGAVGRNWKQATSDSPFDSVLLTEWIAQQRQPLLAEGEAAGVFAVIALLLGCLGLLGLSVSEATRRTKEIGIRKAMGAGRRSILTMVIWQFAKPVMWANLFAWPLAFWIMGQWLNGFAFHVAMPLWVFPAVGAATLLIALLTVLSQAVLIARQKPVLALRYE